jgi:hypothetical protein
LTFVLEHPASCRELSVGYVSLVSKHYHPDGSIGVADLIGYKAPVEH